MPHSLDQWLTLVVALIGAVQAWLAQSKAGRALEHAAAAAHAAEALQEHPALAVPAAGAPGVSLPQLLQYWDLLTQFISYWQGFKSRVKGALYTIPVIRTKINGRRIKVGPIPVEFED